MLIRKPLWLMADDGGTPGAGEGGAGDGGASGGSGGDAGTQGKADEGKTFTQADVDRIIAGRLAKYADYDDLRKQVEAAREASLTEQEKAVKEAKEAALTEGRSAALDEIAPRLVAAEFRAASAGRMTKEQLDGFLEDINPKKYLTDSGEVDIERVAKKVELLAPPAEERKTPAPSFGGGPRKTDSPEPPPGVGRLTAAYAAKARK